MLRQVSEDEQRLFMRKARSCHQGLDILRTPLSKKSSTLTLTKLAAFDSVLSPRRSSRKSLFLQDINKDSSLSIDSVPSKPVRRRSNSGLTHNATFPVRNYRAENASHGQSVWCDSKEIFQSSTSPVFTKPQDLKTKNIFFTKNASTLRNVIDEALLLESSIGLDLSDEVSAMNESLSSLQDARWHSFFVDSNSSLRLKQLSSENLIPSPPRRTVSFNGRDACALR